MFAEVSDRKTYSLNVYSGDEHEVGFDHASTLLLPGMVDDCYAHDGVGPVPGPRERQTASGTPADIASAFCGSMARF